MVTYNWNTKGVGYVENRDGYEIVAFSRTGALPVDYLGEHDSRMRDYEDRGYDYFAGKTNDPNLARVVQYAGFYQICRHFSLNATFAPSTRVRRGADALQPFARRILDLILETDVDARVNPARLTADPELAKDLAEYRKIRSAVQSEAARGEPALQQLAAAMVRLREASRGAGSDPRRRQTVELAYRSCEHQSCGCWRETRPTLPRGGMRKPRAARTLMAGSRHHRSFCLGAPDRMAPRWRVVIT